LFQAVYRHFFDEKGYVECYTQNSIKSQVGLERKDLIQLALLLGSDYTAGVKGIGPVHALEILHEFGDTQTFKDWISNVNQDEVAEEQEKEKKTKKKKRVKQNQDEEGHKESDEDRDGGGGDSEVEGEDQEKHKGPSPLKRKLLNMRKNLEMGSDFPNPHVIEAYLQPQVDVSEEKFIWNLPDLDSLRTLAQKKFGWPQTKADLQLLPVMKKLQEKKNNQQKIDNFFHYQPAPTTQSKKSSKRLNNVVQQLVGKSAGDKKRKAAATTSKDKGKKKETAKPRNKKKG